MARNGTRLTTNGHAVRAGSSPRLLVVRWPTPCLGLHERPGSGLERTNTHFGPTIFCGHERRLADPIRPGETAFGSILGKNAIWDLECARRREASNPKLRFSHE